jgi:hypothetical protein
MHLATQTKALLDYGVERDGGATYRGCLREAILELTDAFDSRFDPYPRAHLGASLIGTPCLRALWLSFRWTYTKKIGARLQRLFNRGHLEEGRFIALFRAAGLQVATLGADGKQFRFDGCGDYYGGSLDAMVFGLPEFPNEWCLSEFKTHSDKSFKKLQKEGVASAKPEHYVQMQQYMAAYGLKHALYVAVNKNDDEIHCEFVTFDATNHAHHATKAAYIVASRELPPRISASPVAFGCKYCDAKDVCFGVTKTLKTCRTCEFVEMPGNGEWVCGRDKRKLDKAAQFAGCEAWRAINSEL